MGISSKEEKIGANYSEKSWGIRHVQAFLIFFLLVAGMGSRLQLSVAIVAMTDNSTSSNPDIPTYNWTNKSVILSSFYWGYLFLQIFVGALSEKYSTKIYLLITTTVNATICLLVPLAAAKFGSTGVMVCRILQGFSQGGYFPSVYVLLGRWAPLGERARLTTIALGGASVASLLTSVLVGYLSSSWMGWPSSFYTYGGLNLIWVGLFFMFGADSPRKHSTISYEERTYIETSLNKPKAEDEEHLIPFKPVLTSLSFWALTLNNVALNWGQLTLGNEMPDYMSKVMKYDISSDGLLSSLPSAVGFILSFFYAALADYIINKDYWSRTTTRKIFTMFGNFGSSIPILILAFLPANANTVSVIMLVLSSGLGSASNGGASVNHIDLSPKYSGFIMSITNTLTIAIGLTGPLLVQLIVTDETVKSQWTIIFVISSVLTLAFTIVYMFFASGDVQWWNFYGVNIRTKEEFEKLQEVENSVTTKKKKESV